MQLFSVPLVVVDNALTPSATSAILDWTLNEEKSSEGLQISNVGGWHSLTDLPARGVEALDTLFSAMTDHIHRIQRALGGGTRAPSSPPPRIGLQAWAVVLRNGGYMRLHDHANAHWSAVFYADAGDPREPLSGRICFVNPVGACRVNPGVQIAPTTFDCMPITGQLIVFPGWLRHYVEPYRGTRPRVVISANVELTAA